MQRKTLLTSTEAYYVFHNIPRVVTRNDARLKELLDNVDATTITDFIKVINLSTFNHVVVFAVFASILHQLSEPWFH